MKFQVYVYRENGAINYLREISESRWRSYRASAKCVCLTLNLGRYRVYRVFFKSVLVYTYVICCVVTNWGTHTCQPRNYWKMRDFEVKKRVNISFPYYFSLYSAIVCVCVCVCVCICVVCVCVRVCVCICVVCVCVCVCVCVYMCCVCVCVCLCVCVYVCALVNQCIIYRAPIHSTVFLIVYTINLQVWGVGPYNTCHSKEANFYY